MEDATSHPRPEPGQPRPGAFIVGAPRCGTTALADFLGQHPRIFVPYVKEPHYFGSDLTPRRGFPTLASYLELFADAGDRLAMEGSTWYLYSRRAAQEIHAFDPEARIVIVVRDPVEMLYSWHAFAVLDGSEPLQDFAEALDAEPDRRAGRLPRATPRERLLYREIPRFSEQIERYLDAFGRSRVKILVHDDFKRDNRAVVQEVFGFLGVDDRFEPDLRVVNSNAVPKSRALQRLLTHPPEPVRAAVRSATPRRLRNRVRQAIQGLNSTKAKRPPMDPALRHRLSEEFAPEVERLSDLLGRDLSHWSSP